MWAIMLSLLRARRDRRDESEATTAMREMKRRAGPYYFVCTSSDSRFSAPSSFYIHHSGLSRRGNQVVEGFGLSLALLRQVAFVPDMEKFVL